MEASFGGCSETMLMCKSLKECLAHSKPNRHRNYCVINSCQVPRDNFCPPLSLTPHTWGAQCAFIPELEVSHNLLAWEWEKRAVERVPDTAYKAVHTCRVGSI